MHDAGKILAGVVIFFALMSYPIWVSAASGKTDYVPEPQIPADETQCIESRDYMRLNHMDLLGQWKQSVVRGGETNYVASDGKEWAISLTETCMSCHSTKAEFCDLCHKYVGAEPECWTCHTELGGDQ
jgi:hypothetical protein